MEEGEEYDSDNSDSTVLLTDYIDNPQKIDMKRRRLSNLNDKSNRSDEFKDENKAPNYANSSEKKNNNVDKNWHISKYFASISKNNPNIQNNDSKNGQKLDFNENHVRNNFQNRDANISKVNSTNIDNDEIICLDSDDETLIDDESQARDRKGVEILAGNDRINNPNMNLAKPAPLTTRRATTGILEQSIMLFMSNTSQILKENKLSNIAVFRPSAINARRATTHFEENNLNSNVIVKTTSVLDNICTGKKNERKSDIHRSIIPRLPESQSADINTSNNADCNKVNVIRPSALDNNTSTSPLPASIKPLKMYIDQNNGLSNKDSRLSTNILLNIKTHKRLGIKNDIQMEAKRIKIDDKSTDPALLNKNTPRKDIKITELNETKKLEASQTFMNVRKEIHVPRTVDKNINDHLGTERSDGHNENNTSVVKNTTGVINEKLASDSGKSKTAASNVKSNEKLEACNAYLNVKSTEHKGLNDGSEKIDRCDKSKANEFESTTSTVKENRAQYAKTLNNVCEIKETSRLDILHASSTSCDKEETPKVQDADALYGVNHKNVINNVQNKQIISEVTDAREASKKEDDRGTDKVLDEFKTRKLQDEQGKSVAYEEEETNKEQYDFKSTEAREKYVVSKVQNDKKVNENETSEIQGKAKHKQPPSKKSFATEEKKISDDHEIKRAQNYQVTNELNNEVKIYKVQDNHEAIKIQTSDEHDMNSTLNNKKTGNEIEVTIVSETNDRQETDIVNNQLERKNAHVDHIPSNSMDKQETREAANGQEGSKVRKNDENEMQERQETLIENETTESSNVQETVKESDTTRKASRDNSENNDRVLKFQVGFFTLVKEYLKDIFPESAMELHNLIETLIIDTSNGHLQTDVKYSCPKCSCVSNYSSSVLNNLEKEENKTNADGYQKCGFCNGIRKLHNSYLKRFLAKKYSIDDKKEDVTMVSPGKEHAIAVEQSRNSTIGEIVINISQMTSEAKIGSNLGSTSAGEDSNFSSIINNDKQVENRTLTQNNCKENRANNPSAKEHPVPNEIPSINISQLDICSSIDNSVYKDAINKTTPPVAIGIDTVKRIGIETSDKYIPITKENKLCTQSKPSNFEEASTATDLELSNKRKIDIACKETSDHKRIKTNTEETNHQIITNLTAEVSESSTQRNYTLANELPSKIQILSIQTITSHGSLQSDTSIDTGIKSAANSEHINNKTPEKSSNESTKEFQTKTNDRNTSEACLSPKTNSDNRLTAEAEKLSEDGNQAIQGKSTENIDKDGRSIIDETGKKKSSNNTSTGNILETIETNANQVRNTEGNYQGNEDVLKPLMDCFAIIKNRVKEKEETPIQEQEGTKIPPESASKVRGNRSNSLDNLQNLDVNNIVMKYVCPICTSMYVYASKLIRHMLERHNSNLTTIPVNCERVQCPVCRKLLSNKSYNKHIKYHHDKYNENVCDIGNSKNTNKCKKEKLASIKNKIFLNRRNNESNKSLKSPGAKHHCITPDDKKLTSNVDTTRQQKNQKRSEYKYQHLIKRIKIGDINPDNQHEIPGKKKEELGQDKDDTQHPIIENESCSPAVTSMREKTSNINRSRVNYTEWCRDKSDKTSALKSAAKSNRCYKEERTPSECNDRNLDKIQVSDVSFDVSNDNMHDTSETCHAENNDSKSDKTETEKSNTSEDSFNNQIKDAENSRRRVGDEAYNESENSNSRGIDNEISVTNGNETLSVTCTVENGKHGRDELSIRYINHGKQSAENTEIEGNHTCGSNINKEKETDSEDYYIKASDHTVKKRKERIIQLFGEENDVSVSSLIPTVKESKPNEESGSGQSSELDTSKKEHQIPKNRERKTERRIGHRKADVVHTKRKVTVVQCTASAESSDSDWIISNDESSDSCVEFCTIKKQQALKNLFCSKKKPSVLNETNEESYTESGENNDDTDEETIKSSRYTVMKKNERLSRIFGDDDDFSLLDEMSKDGDIRVGTVGSNRNSHRSDRQCAEIEECNKESVPNNNEDEVPSDNETLKISKYIVKKRLERISNQFGDYNEQDSNLHMENSDMNNTGCSAAADSKSRNISAEDKQSFDERQRPVMIDDGSNNENYVKEIDHQETFSNINRATDRNGIIAVVEEKNMNAVVAEYKSRDNDRIEINMIDRLLKEFDSDDHQNACADKENYNENVRKSEVSSECQATSESDIVKTCLGNIRITNVTSVEGNTHVFICQECNYGTDAYDDAIRHCQNHFNLIEDQITYCDICQINYDTACFERHQSSHDKYLGTIKIKFSYHWLFTNWQVIFENITSLSEVEDMQVKSIYKTFCVKMSVKEDGPWQSAVYLCAKCNACVPSVDVEKHVQQNCSFNNYPCRICDRVFSTYELRKHHEIYHAGDASEIFKTIVFNDPNDERFNSKLIQLKTQSKENEGIVDIYKCLCGLCFISLKKFKLHFADCDPELNDGRQCPRCTGIRLFSNTEIEDHLLLHHSSLNYELRVHKITFQLESIIDNSVRESLSEFSNGTDNATQVISKDEDFNIKRNMLKDETITQRTDVEIRRQNLDINHEEGIKSNQLNEPVSKTSDIISDNATQMESNDVDLTNKGEMLKAESLTQTTDEGNRHKNINSTGKEDINTAIINETVPNTSIITTNKVAQITLNDEHLNIEGNIEPLKQSSDGVNRRENKDNVEEEHMNRRLINEMSPEINDEDLIFKREMLKEESLTQNTNKENTREMPDTDKKEDISREGNSQEFTEVEDSENPVDIESSQKVLVVKQSVDLINIEDSQIINWRENLDNNHQEDITSDQFNVPVSETSKIISDNAAQITSNDLDLIIKREMIKAESLSQTTDEQNMHENINSAEKEDINIAIINETVPKTFDCTTDKVGQITQNSHKEGTRENKGNVEKEDINSRLINKMVPEINDEYLIFKREILKEESLTQNTNKENTREMPDTDEKEDISREGNSREFMEIVDFENPVDIEASQKVLVVEQSVDLINIEDSQEINWRENLDNNHQDITSDQFNAPVSETSKIISDNAAQITSNDLDLIIKREMIKAESLSQTTDEQNMHENINNAEKEDINKAIINETVPKTSDCRTDKVGQITSNDEDLNIKKNKEPLTQNSDGEGTRKNKGNVEKEDINSRLINEMVPEINDEDLIFKREMLKDEMLTQSTNEGNSQEMPDTDENEDITRQGNSQEIRAMDDSENPVDIEASQEVMVVEQSLNLINIEDSQEINEVQDEVITIENSQEMDVDEFTHLITVEDSDDDVEIIGESFPNMTKIFPLRYCSRR